MNTAKLVNSALTGGGLIYPENLNVIIGNEDKGYPKGYVLDANASKAYLFLDANINNLKVADADAVDTLALKNCALEVWTAVTKDDLDNLDPYVTGVTSDNIHAGEILAKKI